MMHYCDVTLPGPAENLACDEALLELCESTGIQILRLWEPHTHFVVVGYANHVETEVNLTFCALSGIPILRRSTGGGTVLQGPGCLNYSLILRPNDRSPLQTIPGTNAFILDRHRDTLAQLLGESVAREGQTDLAIRGYKFSGNAQRRRKDALLFHGSFLLNFDLAMVEKALPFPSRQPEYRRNRPHASFLLNLKVQASGLKAALIDTWGATTALPSLPVDKITRLVNEKYSRPEWNLKF